MGAISGLDLIEKEKLDYTIKIQSFNDLFSLFMILEEGNACWKT